MSKTKLDKFVERGQKLTDLCGKWHSAILDMFGIHTHESIYDPGYPKAPPIPPSEWHIESLRARAIACSDRTTPLSLGRVE